MKFNSSEIKKFLDYASEKGVEFVTFGGYVRGGHFGLDTDDVIEFIKDPEEFIAHREGITKQTYLDYCHFKANNLDSCQIIKANGERCNGYTREPSGPNDMHLKRICDYHAKLMNKKAVKKGKAIPIGRAKKLKPELSKY